MHWFALYTKPRNEKKVAEALQKIGITAYCPLVTRIKQWSDRKKKVTEPLLPSYVFVQLEEQHRKEVFQVNGVVQYVFWLGKPAIIKDHEIEALQSQLSHPDPVLEVALTAWQPNAAVQIPEGPFKGQEAIVQNISPTKVKLLIQSLNLYVTLERQATP
jgi:transcription antitermination factor NusG